jgi:hypothetical protein
MCPFHYLSKKRKIDLEEAGSSRRYEEARIVMVGASKAINFVCWFWLVWFGPVNG